MRYIFSFGISVAPSRRALKLINDREQNLPDRSIILFKIVDHRRTEEELKFAKT